MSRTDRLSMRARKSFARAIAEAAHSKAENHAARTVARAERRENAARRRYLEALRLDASDSEAWA